ncbi:MAG: SURF1 family cytochrome oxidase biogenesis protein [Dermabacter sp.]|nr:SURF1 family cytochrome oxidase biogenesis protein [Dermabacter sp.]
MLSVALRPKYLGILALMVTATLVCGLLANWQWDRATRALNITQATQESAPVPISTLLRVGDTVTNETQGRLVSLTGHFEPELQAVSPGRRIDGDEAAVVVTSFLITDGELAGVRVPVARGYLPLASADGADADGTASGTGTSSAAADAWAHIPPPPTGTVELVARLEASEGASDALDTSGDASLAVIDTISSPLLVNMWGGPMLAAYLAITEPAAAQMEAAVGPDASAWTSDLGRLPSAESHFSSGLNLQNFGYMLQWIVFGVFFLYIWWRTVRTQYLDEARERRLALEARVSQGGGREQEAPASSQAQASAPPTAHSSSPPAAPPS